VKIISDHKREKVTVTKIGTRLTKLSQKQFSLSIMECQLFQMYLNQQGNVGNIVNMWWKRFCVYAQIVSDINSERMTKIA